MDCPPHGPYAPDIVCKCKQCVDEAAVADTARQLRNLLDYLHRMSEDVTEEGSGPAAPANQEAPEEHPVAPPRPRLRRRLGARGAPDSDPPPLARKCPSGTYARTAAPARTRTGEEEDWESAPMDPPCPTRQWVHSRRVRVAQREKLWSPYTGDEEGDLGVGLSYETL